MRKWILKLFALFLLLYIGICILLFLYQEKLIFFPDKQDKSIQYNFANEFDEHFISLKDGNKLHTVLFKSDSAKGVIFYLHGNGGSIYSWGDVTPFYNQLGYDVWMTDYRGYGKSEGSISSEKQFLSDLQTVYDTIKKHYSENNIIVLGYSIGTGPATYIASANHPRLLILQAPYYSLTDMMKKTFPLIPAFLLRYKFETYVYLKQCVCPVVLFHGTQDETIYYGSSLKLSEYFKRGDTLYTLQHAGHNGMSDLKEYQKILSNKLCKY